MFPSILCDYSRTGAVAGCSSQEVLCLTEFVKEFPKMPDAFYIIGTMRQDRVFPAPGVVMHWRGEVDRWFVMVMGRVPEDRYPGERLKRVQQGDIC